MDFIRRILSTEAIVFTRVVTSVAAMLVALGVPIPDADVEAAVEGVTMLLALGNLLLGVVERRFVFSRATHEQEVAEAFTVGIGRGLDERGA